MGVSLQKLTSQGAVPLNPEVPIFRGFVFFDLDSVGICVGVLPDAGHLPGNFHVRLARPNHKTIVIHLLGYDSLGELAYNRQLIAEITIGNTTAAIPFLSETTFPL
jgi:hypothetical protein